MVRTELDSNLPPFDPFVIHLTCYLARICGRHGVKLVYISWRSVARIAFVEVDMGPIHLTFMYINRGDDSIDYQGYIGYPDSPSRY
jgi:hypothetical protein